MTEKILVTGSSGQIGTELVPALIKRYGKDNVISVDIQEPKDAQGIFHRLNMTDKDAFAKIVKDHNVTQIYHLVGILSATGEKDPSRAWAVNMETLRNVLEIAKERNIRVFWPSSIAAFGATTPKDRTPQDTIFEPTTMYGVTKVAGEKLCYYYHKRFGVDVRSIRYPGLISWKQEPGGGTTDYAVAIFYDGLQKGSYDFFVSKDTALPMMYMDDAVRGTLLLMDAPAESLSVWTSYNFAAISFTAEELAREVQKHIPNLTVAYKPDERQNIADSWPRSIDDSIARKDWGWKHEFDLSKMTTEMILRLREKFKK